MPKALVLQLSEGPRSAFAGRMFVSPRGTPWGPAELATLAPEAARSMQLVELALTESPPHDWRAREVGRRFILLIDTARRGDGLVLEGLDSPRQR